ncbi:MAG: glycosyltransferase, partial [Candidatus Hydrothermae bacterium]|nr:glycosyltransferase [Candidatus Hydrothermae bacterium]
PFRRMGRELTPAMRRWKTYRQALADLPSRGVRWIFPSRYAEQRFREAVPGAAPGLVLLNFPGVSLARKTPTVPRVWGWMGSLSPGKGVDLLLEAWARCGRRTIPKAELHLWGAPAPGQVSWWQVLWRRYRHTPGVFWHGPFNPTDTEKVMQAVDAVVLPSRVAENCPLTVVDALALGRWVLASNRGGLTDLLPGAYRFEPEVEGLCEAWSRVRRLPPPPWPARIPSEEQYVEQLLALAEEVMREHE